MLVKILYPKRLNKGASETSQIIRSLHLTYKFILCGLGFLIGVSPFIVSVLLFREWYYSRYFPLTYLQFSNIQFAAYTLGLAF